MPLKNKTFIALTVKLLIAVSGLQAQAVSDSVQQQKNIPSIQSFILSVKQPVLPNQVPANYYAKQLPFFCNKELQVQKAVGFPIKLRLGSVEYCDKLEGKHR